VTNATPGVTTTFAVTSGTMPASPIRSRVTGPFGSPE
jgi:hypothetical protein